MAPASALKALKQQLDKGLVPGHLFGFAEQPQGAPSCVQRWREAAPAPCGVWISSHLMQLPAALMDHHHQTSNKHGSVSSTAKLQKLHNDAAMHQKQRLPCLIEQANYSCPTALQQ